jgi:hypothetical protein
MSLIRTIFAAFTILAVLNATPAQAIPRDPNKIDTAELRADGSVVIKPGQSLALSFEVKDGKLVKFAKLPWTTKQEQNVLRISLGREGGVATSLGPTSQIVDHLFVTVSPRKPLSARSEFTTLNALKPQRAKLSAKDGDVKRSYRWGVSQIILSEFEVAEK